MTAEKLSIDTIRVLSMDAVQKANSGHPGTPMALAPLGYALFAQHMRHDPQAPGWWDRDRFVLSCGHASMLLYSCLHMSGYDVSLEDLKEFRQWESRTPGHPEYDFTPGVETTTGPLGQGVGNAVGMAIAERFLAARYNRPGHTLFDHYTYVICSDGDLMEGVASEAASLAGHLKLGKLVGGLAGEVLTASDIGLPLGPEGKALEAEARALAAFFLALAVPSALLIAQAYDQLKWGAFRNTQIAAEEVAEVLGADQGAGAEVE